MRLECPKVVALMAAASKSCFRGEGLESFIKVMGPKSQ